MPLKGEGTPPAEPTRKDGNGALQAMTGKGRTPVQLDDLLNDLRERGLRITPQRREIVKLLLRAEGHLTAQEVYERLQPRFPEISRDTVYRTLRTLAVLGLACQSHLQTPEASRFALAQGHHHHMVCIDCGRSVEVADCPITSLVEGIAARHGFVAAGHALEIYGYCTACSTTRSQGGARP